MTKFNTLLRAGYTLGVYLILSQSASAQTDSLRAATVLNFVKSAINERSNPVFSIANPTSNFADVQFTYYGLDGNPVSSGLVNPVRYRVAPKGQISMRATDLFAAAKADGWVQVTSATAGLAGFYLSGDFATTLEGSDSAPALATQVVPVIRDDQANKTELVIVNPGSSSGSVSISLYSAAGQPVSSYPSQVIAAHAAIRLPSAALNISGAGVLSARINASVARSIAMRPPATATRRVTSLAATSTMCACPAVSK